MFCASSTPCQVATAVSPAVLFCSGEAQHTTKYDYVSGVSCGGEHCWLVICFHLIFLIYPFLCYDLSLRSCSRDQPSAYKFECDNDASVIWGCGTLGGITTGSAAEGLITVAGSAIQITTTGAMQTSFGTASSSAAISSPKTTSAYPAMTSTSASPAMTSTSASPAQVSTAINAGNTSSGLSAGAKAGSVVGATLAAIALVIAIFFGYQALQRRQQHRQRQSQIQREGLLETHAVADGKKDTELREPGAEPPLSELAAENEPERPFNLHDSRAELL